MFKGLLLKESLTDESVLDVVKVTKTEVWDADNPSPIQPKKWTAISFEADDEKLDTFLDKLSKSLKPKAWFVDLQIYIGGHRNKNCCPKLCPLSRSPQKPNKLVISGIIPR